MIQVNEIIEFGSWSWNINDEMVTFSPKWFETLGYHVPKNLNQNIDIWSTES
jgi:hypothetical protein